MESGSASPPHFLVSTQLSQALTMLQEGAGSLRALPPREPPSLPHPSPSPPTPPTAAAEPATPARRRRWLSRDEAGHTHSILASLAGPCQSRWKNQRTLHSPNSFSESSTPSQPPQVRVFSKRVKTHPHIHQFSYFSSQERGELRDG